jgi:hypothetical protein
MQVECESFQDFLKLTKAHCKPTREPADDYMEDGAPRYAPICFAAAATLDYIESIKGKTTGIHYKHLCTLMDAALHGRASLLHVAYEVPMSLSQKFRHAVLDHLIEYPDLTAEQIVVVCRNLATKIVHEHATHSTTK